MPDKPYLEYREIFPSDLQFIYSAVVLHVHSLFQSESPQSAIKWFLFQFPVSSLSLKIIQWLLTYSSSSSLHYNLSSIFLQKRVLEGSFYARWDQSSKPLLFITSRIFLSCLTLCEPYFRFINSCTTIPTYFYICSVSDCCAENRLHGNLHFWLIIIS